MNAAETNRRALQSRLFPDEIPTLWCPLLTHFRTARVPDAERIRSHLAHLAPQVRGLLVPGSTGEGWEMTDQDIRELLKIVVAAAESAKVRVLVAILKTETEQVLASLASMRDVVAHPAVAGITVCPPKGESLGQAQIAEALRRVLHCGLPTALYQLPQITGNEMSAETLAALAAEFSNFILFKDTSGADRVAFSGLDFGGVFMVRGAEQGGYARWTRGAGGPYDGFLLSTANVFAPELQEILQLLARGETGKADAVSVKLESIVTEMFALASGFPVGNTFANANKLLDHLRAYGERFASEPSPMLYSGVRLPTTMLERAREILSRHQMMPRAGYL